MQFVDEKNHIALRLFNFLEYGLESVFELTPVLCTGKERAHIKCNNALVAQALWYVARRYPLGKPLGYSGLANARLSYQYRVIFRSA